MVPADITNVDATISSPGMAYQENDLAMTLDGCGGFSNAGALSGNYGGPMTRKYRVCKEAAPGTHAFIVRGGPASYIEGTLRLVGQRPAANETAPA